MTKFRWHRGGLAESMETVMEVESFEELRQVIDKSNREVWCNPVPVKLTTEINVEPYGFDERIGWDTHIVSQRIVEAGERFCACGFTDGPLAILVEGPEE